MKRSIINYLIITTITFLIICWFECTLNPRKWIYGEMVFALTQLFALFIGAITYKKKENRK